LQHGSLGLLPLLDEEVKIPKSSDLTYLSKINQARSHYRASALQTLTQHPQPPLFSFLNLVRSQSLLVQKFGEKKHEHERFVGRIRRGADTLEHQFGIVHYAGVVAYDVRGFSVRAAYFQGAKRSDAHMTTERHCCTAMCRRRTRTSCC
jgi:hypothetical protein